MALTAVGARLTISGRSQAVADLTAFAAALDKTAASVKGLKTELVSLSTVSEETQGKIVATSEATAAAQAGSAAAVTKSVKKQAAAAKEAQGIAGTQLITSKKVSAALLEEEFATTQAVTGWKKYLGVFSAAGASPLVGKLALGSGAALGGILYEGIKGYQKYQQQMTQLITMAGIPQKQLPGLMNAGMAISRQTGESLTDYANQMYRIASAAAGIHLTTQELQAQSKTVAQMTQVFGVTGSQAEQLARVFGALQFSKKSLGLQGVPNNYKQMAALITASVGMGDIRGNEMVSALGSGVLASAGIAGVKLPDVLTMIDLWTKAAGNPRTAGTLLSHAIQLISNPSAQGTKAMGMFGIQPEQLNTMMRQQGIFPALQYLGAQLSKGVQNNPNYPITSYGGSKAGGMAGELNQLQSWGLKMNPQFLQDITSGKMSPLETQQLMQFVMSKSFGGARQEMPVLMGLQAAMSGQGQSIEAQMTTNSTVKQFEKFYQIQMNTAAQQQKVAMTNLRDTMVQIGKDTIGVWNKILGILKGFAAWLGNNPIITKSLLGILGFVAVSATLLKAINIGMRVWNSLLGLFKTFGGLRGGITGTAQTVATSANTVALEENTAAIIAAKGWSFTSTAGTDAALLAEGGAGGAGALALMRTVGYPIAAAAAIFALSYGGLKLAKSYGGGNLEGKQSILLHALGLDNANTYSPGTLRKILGLPPLAGESSQSWGAPGRGGGRLPRIPGHPKPSDVPSLMALLTYGPGGVGWGQAFSTDYTKWGSYTGSLDSTVKALQKAGIAPGTIQSDLQSEAQQAMDNANQLHLKASKEQGIAASQTQAAANAHMAAAKALMAAAVALNPKAPAPPAASKLPSGIQPGSPKTQVSGTNAAAGNQ